MLGTIAGCLALPVLAKAANPTQQGWQGRYGLPLLVGIPILAGWIVDRAELRPGRALRTLGVATIVGIAAAYVVANQQLMTRNVVGLPNSTFAGLTRGSWDGPGSPILLFVWSLIAAAAYAAVAISLFSDPSPEVADATAPRADPKPRPRKPPKRSRLPSIS